MSEFSQINTVLANCLNWAMCHYINDNYGRAFAHLMTLFEIEPSFCSTYRAEFVYSLKQWGLKLERDKRLDDVRMCYMDALKYYPTDTEIIKNYVVHLMRMDNLDNGIRVTRYISEISSKGLIYKRIVDLVKLEMVSRWHFRMVNDYERNMAYYKALLSHSNEKTNKLKVIDLGAGSGLLSLFASNSPDVGEIYAIEGEDALAEIAKSNIRGNYLNNVSVINKLSSDLNENDINGRADLVVTEIFDGALFGERCLTTLTHAWKELLKENAKIIPNSSNLFIMGVKSHDLNKRIRVLKNIPLLKNSIIIGKNNDPYEVDNLKMIQHKQITEIKQFLSVNFCCPTQLESLLHGEICEFNLKCICEGEINAFVIWFDLNLDDHIKITTNPYVENVKCWEQGLFYIDFPKVYQKDDEINLKFSCFDNRSTLNITDQQLIPEHFQVNLEMITFLNDPIMTETITNLAKMFYGSFHSVLDYFNFPLFGLLLAKNGCNSHILSPNENEQILIDHLIKINNISNIQYLSDDKKNDFDDFDTILFDVINVNGTLDSDIYNLLWKNHSNQKQIFPNRIKLIFQLIESDYLNYCSRANDDNSFAFKIANQLNTFAIDEHWMFDMKTSHEKLTKKFELDILRDDEEPLISEHLIQVIQKGRTHGVLYWFELYFGDDLKINTLQSEYYNKACFLLDKNDIVYENNYVKVSVRQHRGNLKISLNTFGDFENNIKTDYLVLL
nr:protein arginine N-methyltransferase 9-like [Onthophagus taurus]